MGKSYKRLIALILIILLAVCSLGLYYKHFLKNRSDGAIIVKLSNLSINFLDGNIVKTNKKESTYNISITNDSNEDIYYTFKLDNIKKLGKDVTLTVNDKTTIDVEKADEIVISKGIKIASNETQNYTIKVYNPKEEKLLFDIVVKEEKEEEITITKTIINNNIIKNNPQTKVGEEIAVNEEGLISDLDDIGITYYFRGNVTNNYFKFADKMWRIVRINGDNSVRLILDEKVIVNTSFSDAAADYLETKVYQYLSEWFQANLFNEEEYIYSNKYCYDYNLSTDNKTYTSYNRISVAKLPSFNCADEPFSMNIGLLSVDEAIYAGLLLNTENKSNYLYNAEIGDYWLITPATLDNNKFHPFVVKNDGSIITSVDSKSSKAIRPVINISPYVKVTGDGTKDNPYMIEK